MQKAQQEVGEDNREDASKSKVKVMSSRVSLVSNMLKARYEFTKLWQETDTAKKLQSGVNMVQGYRKNEVTGQFTGKQMQRTVQMLGTASCVNIVVVNTYKPLCLYFHNNSYICAIRRLSKST